MLFGNFVPSPLRTQCECDRVYIVGAHFCFFFAACVAALLFDFRFVTVQSIMDYYFVMFFSFSVRCTSVERKG